MGAGKEAALQAMPGLNCSSPDYCVIYPERYVKQICGDTLRMIGGRLATDQEATQCAMTESRRLRFGPSLPSYYAVRLKEGRVGDVRLTFAVSAFAETVAALTEKYGRPSSDSTTPVQNKMGASFDSRVVVWSRPDAVLKAEQRCLNVDESCVSATATWYSEARSKDQADKAKAAVKSL